MRLVKTLTLFVVVAGIVLVAIVRAPSVYGQRDDDPVRRARELTVLAGRGAALGVTVRDARPAEAGGDRPAGVVIDEVQPGSPAEKAGLKAGDVVVEFDGERVRSSRQFSRLVEETAPGRTVKATVMRDGRRSDVDITPSDDGRRADVMIHGDWGNYMRDFGRDFGREFGRLGDHFDFDVDVLGGGRRLGVTVEPLTDQLAQYFGAKEGLLVTSVADGSAASRAGLKAGDVITSVDGRSVRTRQGLLAGLREARADEVSIGIVRDRKETTVKAKIESSRRTTRRI
jgi:serine protease Do